MEGNVYAKYYIRTNQEIGKIFLKNNGTTKIMGKNSKIQESFIPLKGESIGFTVKSMEKRFYCLKLPFRTD